MAPKISTIIGGLRIALQALAEKMGVVLRIEGDMAYTDGETIVIPTLPADDREAATLARGYVDHEAAHIAHTDFSIVVTQWTNIIEDVRIEKEQGKRYPGCAVNLKNLTALLETKGKFRGSPEQPLSMLMSWACCRARSDVLDQPLGEIALDAEEFCRNAFGGLFCDQFALLIDRIGACESTADSEQLAKEIEKLINNPPDPPPPNPQEQKGDVGDNSGKDHEPGDGSSGREENCIGSDNDRDTIRSDQDEDETKSGTYKDAAESEQDKDGAESDLNGFESKSAQERGSNDPGEGGSVLSNQDNNDDGRCEKQAEAGDGSAQSGTGKPGDADHIPDHSATGRQKENLRKLKDADADESARDLDLSRIVSELLDREHEEADVDGTLEEVPETFLNVDGGGTGAGDRELIECNMGLDEARRKTSRMRAQLAGLLQAARLKPAFAKKVGHRIDVRSVHLIACRTPDSRVFASRREKVDENTAIVLLIDRSGSMDDNDKIRVARQAAFVTSEALELLRGVACVVGAFPWGDRVVELKSFGDKPRASRFSIGPSGGTPMAEALMWAGMLLTHRPETRRIVIAMTDGQPDDNEKTKKAVERLTSCGIEVYGIGILDSCIDNWLSDTSKVIRRIEELPAALIGLLKEALVTRRKAA